MSSPRLLLLASKMGYQTRSFAEAARRLGIEVIIGSDRCHQLGDPWSDGAVALHFEQPESAAQQLVEAVGSRAVSGVLALGDRQTAAAAHAARLLGLRYNLPESIENSRSKLRQRQVLQAAGLPVPAFFDFPVGEAMEKVLARTKFPCVLKPLRLTASQGVIRANDPDEFRAAVARIVKLLASAEVQVTREPDLDRILVESYVSGGELALEGLLVGGKLRVLALFDKPDPLEGPYFIETIYTTPSRHKEDVQNKIIQTTMDAIKALGLTAGPVHAEMRINDQGVWMLEIAARSIGGLCSRALRFGDGISLEELILRHAIGEDISHIEREEAAAGVMMMPVPKTGILKEVRNIESAKQIPGIENIVTTIAPEQKLEPLPFGAKYLGFMFARGKSPEFVENSIRTAYDLLKVVIRS